jgi:hypothetical protein
MQTDQNVCILLYSQPEVGKVTLQSNGSEAISEDFFPKNNTDKASNNYFFKVMPMKR